MIFTIVGVGPGDPALVTIGAIEKIKAADLVLIPHSRMDRESVAEGAVRPHIPGLNVTPFLFPMVHDAKKRDSGILSQLEELRSVWEKKENIVLPVIGDSTLYATGFYLYELWKKLVPALKLEFVPGISAHSLAASRAGEFLAMGTEILTIIPSNASEERISGALRATDSAAMYKPCILRERLEAVVKGSGPWKKILRIDRAGLPDQRILTGDDALKPAEEYLSLLLLWR